VKKNRVNNFVSDKTGGGIGMRPCVWLSDLIDESPIDRGDRRTTYSWPRITHRSLLFLAWCALSSHFQFREGQEAK